MSRLIIYLTKIAIIFYLASQAFVDYDLFILLFNLITGSSFEVSFGLNATNTFAFLLAAIFITRKELKRSNKISYSYSPESTKLLKAAETTTREKEQFGHLLSDNMKSIITEQFPPRIPLQLSDVLTTKGFELHEENEAEDVLQYVEELSPLEVATNAVLNWVRTEAQYKQFRLELHSEETYEAVAVNSGNSDTNVYLCMTTKGEGAVEPTNPKLAQEAALRMFFEAESQICSEFDAFSRFYQLAVNLPEVYDKFGTKEFDTAHREAIREIDLILEKDPSFLTMQVLRGILYCHHRTKSIKAFDQAETIFEEAIVNAKTYHENRKQERRRSLFPQFLLKESDAKTVSSPKISRQTMRYVQGLSELFIARIFAQNAHRFGSYDNDPQRFLNNRKSIEKRLRHGIRFLGTARHRFPILGRLSFTNMTRIPLAYQVRGLLHHCHDYFDSDEVFYRNPRNRKRTSDAVMDLKRAIKVYLKGVALCGKQQIGGSYKYAIHTGTRIQNNCGFARLYSCLIEAKLNEKKLSGFPDFQFAEFNFYYSAVESETFFGYPFANLGLLYAMAGDWELSWKAGVAALDKEVYTKIRKLGEGTENNPDAWIYSASKLASYRAKLNQAYEGLDLIRPSLNQPLDEAWSYPEGISELSYGFIFRGLCGAEKDDEENFLRVGLHIHKQSLELFIKEEQDELSESSHKRIKNIMTNLIRAFWHFDNRTNLIEIAYLETIHQSLHKEVDSLSATWADSIELEAPEWTRMMNESVNKWMVKLQQTLTQGQ